VISEVIIKRTKPKGLRWPLYCVWGRMFEGDFWSLYHVAANDLAAKDAAHAVLGQLQDMADDLMWSMLTLPAAKGIPDLAYRTIPEHDAIGRCTVERQQERDARRADPESDAA